MNRLLLTKTTTVVALFVLVVLLVACSTPQPITITPMPTVVKEHNTTPAAVDISDNTDNITNTTVLFGLDWTPNTNHTGIYVAQQLGYYDEEGITLDILQAQDVGMVEQAVAIDKLQFGVSFQEAVTNARAEGLPLVSVAAVIQHNTSGFASRAEQHITSPKEFAGKRYGSFGLPIEKDVIAELMACDGASFDTVEFVDIGASDFFVATERGDVDIMWIFYGWTGIEAEIRGIDINMVMINDQHCIPDYYTPVIITNEQTIATSPDMVERFMRATSKGYEYAIAHPEEAAAMLLQAAPELDAQLVQKSQAYLSQQYQADAPRWGEQRAEVWADYATWMHKHGEIKSLIDTTAAFTNKFLPNAK